jgi:hypothetical protein|tara:strand:- start:311 stop:553 length:243 start_codon:yes stop_codon:yes gene_type:complete
MPTYPVKNKETGEEKELRMTMKEYSDWRDQNPDWDRDWSKGCASAGEVGDFQDKMRKSYPGWNDVLHKVGSVPGANVKPL